MGDGSPTTTGMRTETPQSDTRALNEGPYLIHQILIPLLLQRHIVNATRFSEVRLVVITPDAPDDDGERSMSQVWIGTCGWVYPHWRGCFYPPQLPAHEQLSYYAQTFPTVEINRSFYRLPTFEQFQNWAAQVAFSPQFRFAVKASRTITHLKKLLNAQDSVTRLLAAARGLGGQLSIILYQLPPHWHADLARLEQFLAQLPPECRTAFEFRDPSWFEPATLSRLGQLLTTAHATLAIGIGGASPTPPHIPFVGPIRYLRFHAGASSIGFTDAELAVWAERLACEAEAGYESYAYFNNDAEGQAIADARRLREMLGALAVQPR
jgi:uncharacterized protein YecE (DUF72 family)